MRHRNATGQFAPVQADHCPWGHPYTPENTLVSGQNQARVCKHCRMVHMRCWKRGITMAEGYARHPEWLVLGHRLDRGRPIW